MRLSDSVSFGSFVSGRSFGSSLEDVVGSPRFRELLEGFGELPVEPPQVGLREFAGREVAPTVRPATVTPAPASLAGYGLRSAPEPEVLDVASQRAARFGRSVSESDLGVAGAGR